ncbi:serine hydrolase [Melissospora conviva]|uniref:serine hydrolase n=1 Tax=Melissospora conviva TaxID=3388432 RepID=UPI003B7EA403
MPILGAGTLIAAACGPQPATPSWEPGGASAPGAASPTAGASASSASSATPSAVTSPTSAAAADGWARLTTDLEALVAAAASAGITMSVAVTDLGGRWGGGSLTAGAGARVKAASIIKVGLLAALLHQVDRGAIALDKKVTIPAGDANIVGGSGTLRNRRFPVGISLRELAELMVQVSDNTATNVLIDQVGGFAAVNAYLRGAGFAELYLGRKMLQPAAPPKRENYIAAAAVTALLAAIWNGTLLGRGASDLVLDLMRGQRVDTKYGAVVPRRHLANKTGELADVSHDCGVITLSGRELALSTTTSFAGAAARADRYVQDSARLVYDFARA